MYKYSEKSPGIIQPSNILHKNFPFAKRIHKIKKPSSLFKKTVLS